MWTLYVITDLGRKVPHWTDDTRAKCRAIRASILRSGPLARGVKLVIERSKGF